MFRNVHSLQQGNRDRLASVRVQSLGSLLGAVNLDTVSPIWSSPHKLVLEKAEEPETKLPTSTGPLKKQESSRKTSISALLTMPKPLTVWITINWKILKEMGIPDHLICLLRNLYAGQEATVRTGHGTTDWLQIGKGVRQGCILSPCLFNLYAEYIMRKAGLDEAQAGIKIAGNITNSDM